MKFIHISDLHFNPNEDGRTSRNIRATLIPYLKELDISVDELLITGDFRHAKYQKKEQGEIESVVEYIKAIAAAINITDVNHIHLVPGNHDRDRRKNAARAMTRIRKEYDPQNGRFKETDLDLLKQQFEYFEMVCTTLYGPKHYWHGVRLHTFRVLNETVFLYLNTAIMHNSDSDRGRLIIGNDYLDQLLRTIDEKYPRFPIVVLAHHSPDCFEKHEKEAVEDILRVHPNVLLYLCGDAHEAWLRKVNGHLEVTMGCLRQEKGVEETFLYGNTSSQEYIAHHWAKAWEPYTAANKQLSQMFPQTSVAIDFNIINGWQDRIKNESLLPWLRNSPSIDALFPGLFVTPNFISEKAHKDYYTITDLININKSHNIIVTGEAGAGKTTLFRQLFLYENSSHQFLYLHSRALVSPFNELRPYQLFVRSFYS